jgi:predicted nucleic-acid-binding Zn-ribbon protein
MATPSAAVAQAEVIEVACQSCGYKKRFVQGADAMDQTRNVQQIIVVCERAGEIRNISIALDSRTPVRHEPLLARQHGTGTSKLLGIELPKFLVPGNTCPLFPITAYLHANVCPIDGRPGIHYAVVGQY